MLTDHYWTRRRPIGRGSLRVVRGPTTEPISLADARDHLRLVASGSPASHPDDGWITAQLPTARELIEAETGRALAPQTLEYAFSEFPSSWLYCEARDSIYNEIRLPLAAPLIAVESVIYTDTAGVDQTLDSATDYSVDQYGEPAALYPPYGGSWPSGQRIPNAAVRIRYQAGYDTPGSSPNLYALPGRARSAMLLMLGHLYENREAVLAERFIAELPLGVENLVSRLKIDWGIA